jgi:hypothetical protein
MEWASVGMCLPLSTQSLAGNVNGTARVWTNRQEAARGTIHGIVGGPFKARYVNCQMKGSISTCRERTYKRSSMTDNEDYVNYRFDFLRSLAWPPGEETSLEPLVTVKNGSDVD